MVAPFVSLDSLKRDTTERREALDILKKRKMKRKGKIIKKERWKDRKKEREEKVRKRKKKERKKGFCTGS